MWVFWVHASNAAHFEQSYRDIADCVNISERQDPNADVLKLVHDWLRGSNGQWLLILDNVDNAGILLDAQFSGQSQATESGRISKRLRDYLPQSQNGSILITSRSKEAALKLVEQRDIVHIAPMDETHAVELFEKKLGEQDDNSNVAELAAALEYMPFAIIQAAAYISQRAPRCTVRQYLEEFKKSDRRKASLLNHEAGQLRRDHEAKNSILITWQISFDHIRQTRASAADLLSLMSFFDRQGIPEFLLRKETVQPSSQGAENKADDDSLGVTDNNHINEDASSQSSLADEFELDILVLRNYSFISITADGMGIEMHRLVQLAAQKWLERSNQFEKWRHQSIKHLCAHFPGGEYENWPICLILFPHVKLAATQKPHRGSSSLEWASVLYRAAWYARKKGSAADAETLAILSTEARKAELGQEHEYTLNSMSMVASVYYMGGRWDEAEELFLQVMEICNRALGPKHLTTLRSQHNLATTYWTQGRLDKAHELLVQVLERKKRMFGPEHSETLASMHNLAATYRKQGRLDKAEELGVQVTEIHKRVLGPEHPNTLASMHNLAFTYRKQGRLDKAEELYVQVLETQRRVLGREHPRTLISMYNLAEAWKEAGQHTEAMDLMGRCLHLQKLVLGVDHPNTVLSSVRLAKWQAELERKQDATE